MVYLLRESNTVVDDRLIVTLRRYILSLLSLLKDLRIRETTWCVLSSYTLNTSLFIFNIRKLVFGTVDLYYRLKDLIKELNFNTYQK